jgi:hypothetical protein
MAFSRILMSLHVSFFDIEWLRAKVRAMESVAAVGINVKKCELYEKPASDRHQLISCKTFQKQTAWCSPSNARTNPWIWSFTLQTPISWRQV